MKRVFASMILCLAAFVLVSCEKAYIEEDGDKEEATTGGTEDNGGWYNDNDEYYDSEFKTGDRVDVETFRTQPIYVQVWVEGYIVGAATGAHGKTRYEFGPGFTFDTAILLGGSPDADSEDEVISVCLTTCSESRRDTLNLVRHPENKGKRVAVFGVQETYLKLPGIKHIDALEFPAG